MFREPFKYYDAMNIVFKCLILSSLLEIAVSKCGVEPCIRKCCPEGYILKNTPHYACKKSEVSVEIPNESNYSIIYDYQCPKSGICRIIQFNKPYGFYANGSFAISNIPKPPNEYCVNFFVNDSILLCWCIEQEVQPAQFINIGKLSYIVQIIFEQAFQVLTKEKLL